MKALLASTFSEAREVVPPGGGPGGAACIYIMPQSEDLVKGGKGEVVGLIRRKKLITI